MTENIELVKFTADNTDLEKVSKDVGKTFDYISGKIGGFTKIVEKAFGRQGDGVTPKAFVTTAKTIDAFGNKITYVFQRSGQQAVRNAKLISVSVESIRNQFKKTGDMIKGIDDLYTNHYNLSTRTIKRLSDYVAQELDKRITATQLAAEKEIEVEKKKQEKLKKERDAAAVKAAKLYEKRRRELLKAHDDEIKAEQRKNDELFRLNLRLNLRRRSLLAQQVAEAIKLKEKERREFEKQLKLEERAEVETIRRLKREHAQAQADQRRTSANKFTTGLVQGMGGISGKASEQGLVNLALARNQVESILAKGLVTEARMNEILRAIKTNSNKTFESLTADERKAEIALRKLTRAMENLNTAGIRTQDIMLSWQGVMRLFAVQQLHRVIGTISNALIKATEEAKKFSIGIAEIQTISQDAQRTTNSWSSSLIKLSNDFGIDALDATAAAYDAISNQMGQGAAVAPFLSDAFKFARVTASSAEQSINLLSSALNAFGKSTIHTAEVSAGLFKLIDLGRVTAADLANTYGNTAALADSLGVSMNELNAGIATLSIQGVRADTSMTLMNNIFLKLIKPTKEMKSLFDEWGVSSGEAAIQTFGFIGVLQRLESEVQKGGATRLGELVSDMRAIRATAGLTGGSAFANYSTALDKMTKSSKQFDEALKLTEQSIGFRYQKQLVKLQNVLLDTFGSRMVRIITEFGETIGDLDKGLSDLLSGLVNTVEIGSKMAAGLSVAFGGVSEGLLDLSVLIPTVTYALVGMGLASSVASVRVRALWTALMGLATANPVILLITAAVGVMTYAWASHLQHMQKVSSALGDAENRLAQSNDNYTKKVMNNLALESAAQEKALDGRLRAINTLAAAFKQKTSGNIPGISDTQAEINARANSRSQASADPLQKLDLMSKVMASLRSRANEYLDAKQFEDAEASFKEMLKASFEINDEIDDMLKKVKSDLADLVDDKTETAFENSLLGLSDSAKAKKIEQEIKRITAAADQLFNAGKLEDSNKELEKAKSLAEKLAEAQIAAKEAQGLNPKASSIGGFKVREDIVNKQIELQKKLKQELESRSIDEKKLYEENTKSVEAIVKAQEAFNEALIQSNSLATDLKAKMEAIKKIVQTKEAESRTVGSQVIGGIDTFLLGQSGIEVSASASNSEYMKKLNALKKSKEELEKLIFEKADPALVQAKIEETRKSFASIYGDTLDIQKQREAANYTGVDISKVGAGGETLPQIIRDTNAAFDNARTIFTELNKANADNAGLVLALAKIDNTMSNSEARMRALMEEKFPGYLASTVSIMEAPVNAMENMLLGIEEAAKKMAAAVNQIGGSGLPKSTGGLNFAPGGLLGGGLGRDNQMFMGHAGEFMVNAEAAKRFMPQLVAMNSGYSNTISNSRSSTVTVGDVHVHANVQGGKIDTQQVGAQLRRAIQQGTVRLN